ncbi:undecaprenyl-diphosphatase [Catalinimonas alkaloidigena]|uniref:Undecaprenyl-diphosphatase n=1 Tax=Catalinimonas alkaloidigena TaxID=1075417 RepID=A0A1G9DFS1_9BACT|nr:phosphatase PAP2 family protein [Catalinimonas alkaloidigena]SDK62727.1 undecaprenyl-diphosphatase [Catalinimonas alkaloidigena]
MKTLFMLVPIRTRFLPWLKTYWVRLLVLFLGVALPLYLFSELAEEVLEQEAFWFDDPLLLFLHRHATPALDQFMTLISMLGTTYGLIPAAILIGVRLTWKRRWGDLWFWTLALGGSGLLNVAAKHTFRRPRPALWEPLHHNATYSFPSGHTMAAMSFAAAVIVLLWPTRWRWPALFFGLGFAVLVALSRLYLGVHFPSDILAGWAASLAWVIGLSVVLYRHLTKPTPRAEPV